MARGDDSDRANLTSTYGALFFGTPNQGMNIDSLVAMVGDQPNRYLLETLGKGSEVLQNLGNSFNEAFTFKDSEVISFYETKESEGALKASGLEYNGEDGRLLLTHLRRLVIAGAWIAHWQCL